MSVALEGRRLAARKAERNIRSAADESFPPEKAITQCASALRSSASAHTPMAWRTASRIDVLHRSDEFGLLDLPNVTQLPLSELDVAPHRDELHPDRDGRQNRKEQRRAPRVDTQRHREQAADQEYDRNDGEIGEACHHRAIET